MPQSNNAGALVPTILQRKGTQEKILHSTTLLQRAIKLPGSQYYKGLLLLWHLKNYTYILILD